MENNINDIIRERRSIYPKEFNGQVLDDSIIETLLSNANFAPNHKSNYPWRFIVIKGDQLSLWADQAAELYVRNTAAEKFKQAKLDQIKDYPNKISHAIAILMLRDPEVKTILTEDICAVAAAVQNIYLSLSQYEHAAGYWSTGLGTYSNDMREFLKLSDQETLLGYFVLGSVDTKRKIGNRKDYKHFVRQL